MDTQLITPSVDLSGFAAATIRFNEDYRSLGDNADVDVSIDGGSSWTNVLAQTSDARGPRQVTLDITAIAAGESDVKARFYNYNAAWAWWWQVDNILLGSAGCQAGSGGLVVGTVTDGSSGDGINGATVDERSAAARRRRSRLRIRPSRTASTSCTRTPDRRTSRRPSRATSPMRTARRWFRAARMRLDFVLLVGQPLGVAPTLSTAA